MNSFTTDLFTHMTKSHNESNVLLSPFSVSIGLCILLAGANDTTSQQLMTAMHLDQEPGQDKQAALALIHSVRCHSFPRYSS